MRQFATPKNLGLCGVSPKWSKAMVGHGQIGKRSLSPVGRCTCFSQGIDSTDPINFAVVLWGGNSRVSNEGGRPVKSQARATDRVLAMLAVAGLGVVSGCTICPSPYDYSGPVPNGSITQNDFCARSGGTRPLRSGPLVWPFIVQKDGTPEGARDEPLRDGGKEVGEKTVLIASTTDLETDTGSAGGGVITTSAETDVESNDLIWRRPAN
jgi:hypothetical protein